MEQRSKSKVIAILADVPLWTLAGFGTFQARSPYATWLEPLVSEFEIHDDLDIHWITVSKQVLTPQVHTVYGQTIHIVPRGKKMISMLTAYLGESLKIRKILDEIKPELVHAWGSEDVYGIAAAFGPIQNRIFTLQGCLTDYLRLLGGNWLFRLQTLYEKPSIRRFPVGTAESPAAKASLQSINPTMKVELIDYGVNEEFFVAKWLPNPDPVVAFVGGVTKRKGILDLIKIAEAPDLARVTFKIIGDGDLLNSLRDSSPPNVMWMGKCNRTDVVKHLSTAWCLFMPTYADTGPTVIKEARVMGLPILTTTAAGASCYIEEGKSGFITSPGDVQAMTRALLNICQSREINLRMGRHRWDEIREDLHPRLTASKFANLYRELTASSLK